MVRLPYESDAEPSSDERAFDEGFLLGILVGEGHFGGDGRQPQVTLRMHVRHESLFRWILSHFPGGTLFGPYHHGGRHYYQWMARGRFLREKLYPLLERRLAPELDQKAFDAVQSMRARYALAATPPAARLDSGRADA
jgi:hypothetical protein